MSNVYTLIKSLEDDAAPFLHQLDLLYSINESPTGDPKNEYIEFLRQRFPSVLEAFTSWMTKHAPSMSLSASDFEDAFVDLRTGNARASTCARTLSKTIVSSWKPNHATMAEAVATACVVDAIYRLSHLLMAESSQDAWPFSTTYGRAWDLAEGVGAGDDAAIDLMARAHRLVPEPLSGHDFVDLLCYAGTLDENVPSLIVASWAESHGVMPEWAPKLNEARARFTQEWIDLKAAFGSPFDGHLASSAVA